MGKDITISEAKNQQEEKMPLFKKYYQGFARFKNEEWFGAGMLITDKDKALAELRSGWSSYDELKLVSFELPF